MSNKKISQIIFLFSAIFCTPLIADTNDDAEFREFQQAFQKETGSSASLLQQEFSASQKEDEKQLKLEEKAYQDYKKEIEQQWDEFVGSTKKEWVDYGNNKSSRSIVNFEKGEVTLEVILPAEPQQKSTKKLSPQQRIAALTKLKKQLEKIIGDKSVGGESPVKNQLALTNSKTITQKNVNRIAEKLIDENLVVSKKPYVAKDNTRRVKASVKLKMIPNHLKVRADKFAKPVRKYSKKYNVDPALVFALIHTESHFNPKARSHIPAYGLMQLVPRSGGIDAYKHAFGKNIKPSASYLYDPVKNIQLGTAYLDLLSKREFKKITNKTSKMYLVISAYNTGGGNVSRAITGNTNIYKAHNKINSMTPSTLYKRLERKLPYKETRDYLRKVTERKKIYDGY